MKALGGVFLRRGALALLGIGVLALLAGCGGSGPGAASGGGTTVSTLSASGLRYSQLTTIDVVGSGLDQNLQLDGGQFCTEPTRTSASDTNARFTCRTIRVGEYNFRVLDANGRQLATVLAGVPLPQVTLNTSKGLIVVELDPITAPITTNNFLGYIPFGVTSFYQSTIFHRAEAGVSISGGGFTATGGFPQVKSNTTPAVALENTGLMNLRGTIAMVPTPIGSTTQVRSIFLINLRDNPAQDRVSDAQPGYPVFGRVVSGLDVAESIAGEPVNTFFDFAPVAPVTITGIAQTR